jgi:hypothetical protein
MNMANPLRHILTKIRNHVSGEDCACGAYGPSECGCAGVDWRYRDELATTLALTYALEQLANTGSETSLEIARNAQEIRAAGKYTQ